MAFRDDRMSRRTDGVWRCRARRLRTCLAATAGALSILALSGTPSASATTISSPYGPVYEHIYYGPRLAQFLDVYASAKPSSPAVVLVHGGGWRVGLSLTTYERQALALQSRGFTVFVPNYRLDSTSRPAFPIETSDIELATEWAIVNAARYSGSSNDVNLVGGSAGGQLVAIAAEQLDAVKAGAVKGVVTLSAPADFPSLLRMIENGTITNENFILSVNQALGRLDGSNVFASVSEWESYPVTWSPTRRVPAQNCPNWLLFNSEAELIPLSQAQELNAAVAAQHCSATLRVLPGTKHAFAYFSEVAGAIASFIAAQ